MSRIFLVVFVVAMVSLPHLAQAAVIINEVAWMGTSADNGSYCEWVELANTGAEDVSLSGWTLATADGGMSVPLSGSIAAGGFFLIERLTPTACPDPVPGITADVSRTFGAGLSNGGEVLILTSGTTEMERIDASDGWEAVIEGDATQKLTSQRTAHAWVSAAATPRAANVTASTPSVVETEDDTDTTPVVTIGGSSSTSGVGTTGLPKVFLTIGPHRIVIANADTPYRAVVYDESGRLRRSAQVSWTFGDGSRETGTVVTHAYDLPGQYVAVVRASTEGVSAIRTIHIDVVEAKVSIAPLPRGIALANESDQILDVSGWLIEDGRRTFHLPEDTAILPHSKTHVSYAMTGLSPTAKQITLSYPNGTVAALAAMQPKDGEEGSNQGTLPSHTTVLFEETAPTLEGAFIGMMP